MKRTLVIIVSALLFCLCLHAGDFLYDENGALFLAVIQNTGLFISNDGGLTWTDRSAGLPQRIVYPDYGKGIKTLAAAAIGRTDGENAVLLAATSDAIYRSTDSGLSWKTVPVLPPVKPADFFTCIDGDPDNADGIIVGTSYSGILETKDAGKTWIRHDDSLKQLYKGAGFYEEILNIEYSGDGTGRILLGTGYTNESFVFSDGVLNESGKAGVRTIPAPVKELGSRMNESDKPGRRTDPSQYTGRRGIYINSLQAGSDKLDGHLDFCQKQGLDSIVVDFKDDTGIVTFDIEYGLPEKIGAVRRRIDFDELLEKVHSRGMYLIGRIVVFKDKELYKQKGFAIMDKDGGAWGKKFKIEGEDGEITYEQREFWVDPFNPDVWEYNTAIARELQRRGIDEIQFDYIRFPSDGDTSRAVYPSRKPGMTRIEALESFLIRVREEIHIPISTDLYGFNSWYRMGNWIGQSIDLLADYVDIICPMFYPSHFPPGFLDNLEYLERAEIIYREGSNRASAIVGGRAVIRPYVQAFLLPSEYYMEKPEYTKYLRLQVKGTLESSASGFLLWNNSNRYYMVSGNLTGITKAAETDLNSSLD